jgi:prophage DNA circulation protein
MSWRDNLHLEGKGSFKGVEFYVDSITSNIGRRTVLHEFPGKDQPFVEDLGRRARVIEIEAYVLGDDYMAQRDSLRDAIEAAGSGPLTHPYWGAMTVTPTGQVSIRETPSDGGIARIRFQCVEAGSELIQVEPDRASQVEEAATVAAVAVAEQFEEDFETIGYIAHVAAAATNLVNAIISDIRDIKSYVNAAMAIVDTIGKALDDIADAVASLIALPGQLASEFEAVINSMMSSIGSIGSAWDAYFSTVETAGGIAGDPSTVAIGASPASSNTRVDILTKTFDEMTSIGADWTTVAETTPQREQEAANQAALRKLIRAQTVVETCRALVDIPFTSLSEANTVRDIVLDELDTLLEEADDTEYGPFVDLRVAVVQYLADVSAALPRVVSYTPATSLPALVLAQQLYGDPTQDVDLIARNNIRNPCKIPEFAELEILSDE